MAGEQALEDDAGAGCGRRQGGVDGGGVAGSLQNYIGELAGAVVFEGGGDVVFEGVDGGVGA